MPSPWMSTPQAVERIKQRRHDRAPRERRPMDIFMERAIEMARDVPTAHAYMDSRGRQAVQALSAVNAAADVLIRSAGFSAPSSPSPRADEDPDAMPEVEQPTPRPPAPLSGAATAPSDEASTPRSPALRLQGSANVLSLLLEQWRRELALVVRTPIDEEISDLLNSFAAELQAPMQRANEPKQRGLA